MNLATIYFVFVGIIITALIVLIIFFCYFIIFPFSKKYAIKSAHFLAKVWGRIVISLVFVSYTVEGAENYDYDKVYLITPNHQSAFDIFFSFKIFHKLYAFMSKEDIFKIPLLGFAMKLSNYISVKRGSIGAVKSIEDVKDRLLNGISVIMYPEGTRSATGDIKYPKRGLAKVAESCPDIPILPVVIEGTRNILVAKSFKINLFQKVKVRFLPPFYMKDIDGDEKAKLDYWYNLIKNNYDEIKIK